MELSHKYLYIFQSSYGLMTWIQKILVLSKETFVLQKNLVKAYYMFQLITFQLGRHFPETIHPSQSFHESHQITSVCQSCLPLNTPNNLHPLFTNVPFFFFLLFHFDVIKKKDGALLGTFFVKRTTKTIF